MADNCEKRGKNEAKTITWARTHRVHANWLISALLSHFQCSRRHAAARAQSVRKNLVHTRVCECVFCIISYQFDSHDDDFNGIFLTSSLFLTSFAYYICMIVCVKHNNNKFIRFTIKKPQWILISSKLKSLVFLFSYAQMFSAQKHFKLNAYVNGKYWAAMVWQTININALHLIQYDGSSLPCKCVFNKITIIGTCVIEFVGSIGIDINIQNRLHIPAHTHTHMSSQHIHSYATINCVSITIMQYLLANDFKRNTV